MDNIDRSKYRKTDKTLTPIQANVVASVIMLPLVLFIVGGFLSLHGFIYPTRPISILICLVLVLSAYEIMQAGLLSLTCDGGWDSVKCTVLWKSMSMKCNCTELLPKWSYLCVVLAPFIVIVLPVCCMSLITANVELLIAGTLMGFGAGGDVYNAFRIMGEPRGVLLEDHPELVGSIVYYPI